MIRVISVALVTLLAACGAECGGPAGPLGPVDLADGLYRMETLFQPADTLPFGAQHAVQLEVDRSAGTVALVYRQDGKSVREVWRIEASEYVKK